VSVIGAPPAQSHTPPRSIPSTINTSPGLMATPTYAPAGIEAQPQASSTPVVTLAGERTLPTLGLQCAWYFIALVMVYGASYVRGVIMRAS
jgi:hypothetical protein